MNSQTDTHLLADNPPQESALPNQHKGGDITWRTHVLSGISALWLLALIPGALTANNIAALATVAAWGALLPDLDAAESKIKHLRFAGIKPFTPLSTALHHALGHRGLMHSLLGVGVIILLSGCLALWWGGLPSIALVLGYIAHLAGDALTKSGLPLLYPRPQRFHLLPRTLRFTTGSAAEDSLLPFLIAAAGLLLLMVASTALANIVGGA